jgi:hypothetical protein
MTALDRTKFPSTANTYERALVWAAQCVQNIASGKTVLVQQNLPQERACQVSLVTCADGKDYFQIVAYIECDVPALNSGEIKTWGAAIDVSSAAPHVNFNSN